MTYTTEQMKRRADFATELTRLYDGINATYSDVDHMKTDVLIQEAMLYFRRNKEEIDRQLRKAIASFHSLEELTKEEA